MIKKYIYIFLIGFIIAQNEVCFDIEPNMNTNAGFSYFTKYINVLDCFEIYAEDNISDAIPTSVEIIGVLVIPHSTTA